MPEMCGCPSGVRIGSGAASVWAAAGSAASARNAVTAAAAIGRFLILMTSDAGIRSPPGTVGGALSTGSGRPPPEGAGAKRA